MLPSFLFDATVKIWDFRDDLSLAGEKELSLKLRNKIFSSTFMIVKEKLDFVNIELELHMRRSMMFKTWELNE